MIARLSGASARGFLVALVIATPALVIPGATSDTSQMTVLVALLAGFMIFIEYNSSSPSIVEFRDAPPFNRLRFAFLAVTVLLLSLICRGKIDPSLLTNALNSFGYIVGNSLDFPYSPVRMVVLMLPADADTSIVESARNVAGLCYMASMFAVALFLVLVRVTGWPARGGAFNVWVNLPLFDPTVGRDVLSRLQRDARINIAFGFLLPFLLPAVVKVASDLLNPITLENPQTLIWTMTAWAFLPASMIMRGIAMQRIAEMIRHQRRRSHAGSDGELQVA